jgi:hypothetical protein
MEGKPRLMVILLMGSINVAPDTKAGTVEVEKSSVKNIGSFFSEMSGSPTIGTPRTKVMVRGASTACFHADYWQALLAGYLGSRT